MRELTDAQRIARLGSWTFDLATSAVVNSPEVFAIYGIDPVQGVDLFDRRETLYSPESWQRLSAAVGRTFETGEPFELDLELLHPGADSAWVIVSGEVAARDETGEISSLRGTVQEITTRKQSDQEIARSEARCRLLLRATSDLLWSTGDDSGLQNEDLPEWEAFTGQTADDLRGFGWANAIHPDDREMTLALWNFALKHETTFRVQHRLRRYDGVYRVMEVRAVPARDADGQIIEWVGMHIDITEQIAAAVDAGHAHEKLEAVLIGMTDGLVLRDPEGRYTFMSERAAQILGLDRRFVIGKTYWEVFPGARESKLHQQTQLALTTRQPVHFEHYMARDLNKWIEYHCYPTDQGLSVYVRDITERKQAEETLAHAEAAARRVHEMLEGVLAGMTDGLCVLDTNWCFTYLNEQGSRVLGVRLQGMIGLCMWDVFPDAEASAFGVACHKAVDTGRPVNVTSHSTSPRDQWVENHCYPSADGISIYFRDVTAAKLAEEAILRSEAAARKANIRLEGILTGMTDGLIVLDKSWRFTYFNEQAARLLLVNAEDMIGQDGRTIFLHAAGTSFETKSREALATGSMTQTLDFYPEPVNKWLDCHFYPGDEEISIYFNDVTEKQLAAEERLRMEKLSMASSLASSIAAELKNPIESATELLDQTLDMELSHLVRASLLRARQQLGAASQSAIQSLRFEPQPTPPINADVSELMESALEIFAPRFTAGGISVERDYVSYLRLRCHAEELRQVFASLLSNALEATPSGGTVRLRVRPSKFFDGVLVTVADNGTGIPAALRPRIFELFATTKAGSSSGLGLWVSDATVRRHGGRIRFRSRTGAAGSCGTVFSVFLPYDGAVV